MPLLLAARKALRDAFSKPKPMFDDDALDIVAWIVDTRETEGDGVPGLRVVATA